MIIRRHDVKITQVSGLLTVKGKGQVPVGL